MNYSISHSLFITQHELFYFTQFIYNTKSMILFKYCNFNLLAHVRLERRIGKKIECNLKS